MRLFSAEHESRLHELAEARAWAKSGWLNAIELAAVEAWGPPPLSKAAWPVRLLFFALCAKAQFALCVLVYLGSELRKPAAMPHAVLALVSWGLAELLARRYRLYRFGLEEALVAGAVAQGCLALLIALEPGLRDGLWLGGAALALFSAAAYARFGYAFTLFSGALGAALIAPGLLANDDAARVLMSAILLGLFGASFARRAPEWDAPQWRAWQGALGLFCCLAMNLKLDRLLFSRSTAGWSAYAAGSYLWIWLAPAALIGWGLRTRHRPVLLGGVFGLLAAVATNKPYWGLARNAWDPALLGAVLAGGAWWLARRLKTAPWKGVVAADGPGAEGSLAGELLAAAAAAGAASPGGDGRRFGGGGGSAGGGGASGAF